MNSGPRAMRKLSARLVRNVQPAVGDEAVVRSIGRSLSLVRGRPVRLRKTAFPPATVSGLWVDRTEHDLIVYEANTDPEHQLVIIGHEAWHMFQGHCGHGIGGAARAGRSESANPPAEIADLIAAVTGADPSPGAPMDAALHFAARAEVSEVREEVEAELFGFRFATDVRAALAEARAPVDPQNLAERLQASMAHRFRRK